MNSTLIPTVERKPIDFRALNLRQGRAVPINYVECISGLPLVGYIDGFDTRKGAVVTNAGMRLEGIAAKCPLVIDALGKEVVYAELLRQEAHVAGLGYKNTLSVPHRANSLR